MLIRCLSCPLQQEVQSRKKTRETIERGHVLEKIGLIMKKHTCTLLITICFLLISLVTSGCTENIKEPSVAGTFYPADKKELQETVTAFLSKAKKIPGEGNIIALISPHAGYRYSGQVAAYGYKQIQDRDIRKIILIGQSHQENFKGASVYTMGFFKTPLGNVGIDEKSAKKLLNENADVKFYPEAFAKEHSLEVQLPFLQSVLKDFTIIPVLIGSPTRQTFEHLVSEITEMIDEKTLIIASTDLSHYHGYQKAMDMDSKIIAAIEKLSLMNAGELVQSGESEMCGAVPVIIAMEVAKRHGANTGILFNYANSGDVTKEKDRVVGYASIGLFRSPYTNEEKKELLSIARNAVTEYVTSRKAIELDIKNPKLRTDGAVFVTIKEKGSLRGCIGHVQATMPLYQSVIKNAIAASSSDPRFPPMTKDELQDIELEISILSPMQRLKDVKNIQVGKHGLVIRKGSQSGLLLPQVATEQGWDRQTFLKHICLKAGLPEYAWKDAELYTFTAEIIK